MNRKVVNPHRPPNWFLAEPIGIRQAGLGKMLREATGAIVVGHRRLESDSNKIGSQIPKRDVRNGFIRATHSNLMYRPITRSKGSWTKLFNRGAYKPALLQSGFLDPNSGRVKNFLTAIDADDEACWAYQFGGEHRDIAGTTS